MNRYRVEFDQDGRSVIIYDRAMNGVCGLPYRGDLADVRGIFWEFEGGIHGRDATRAVETAEDWLCSCYQSWGRVPKVNEAHPQPIDWAAVAEAKRKVWEYHQEYTRKATEVGDRFFRRTT